MKQLNTPILMVVFNRADKTQEVFNRIREVQPKQLFMSADGPRSHKPNEKAKTDAVRAIMQQVDWDCEVHTLFQTDNLGCRNGVNTGINWFFEQVERGIILEDDCVPDVSFFHFCEEMLERYKDADQVLQISGSNLIADQFLDYKDSYVFSNFALIWGWATWRRAWQKMDLDMVNLPKFKAENRIKDLVPDGGGQYYMLDKFDDTQQKANDSWAYAWFYSLLLHKGLSIVPTKNLIQNVGIGGEDATHTTSSSTERYKKDSSSLTFPLKHPKTIQKHDDKVAMQFFYATQKPYHLLLINKVLPLSWLKKYRVFKKKYLD